MASFEARLLKVPVKGLSRCRQRCQPLKKCEAAAPCVHRRGAKRAVRFGRGEMALDVEGVVDGKVV
jgi:hypothetical protein